MYIFVILIRIICVSADEGCCHCTVKLLGTMGVEESKHVCGTRITVVYNVVKISSVNKSTFLVNTTLESVVSQQLECFRITA